MHTVMSVFMIRLIAGDDVPGFQKVIMGTQ